MVENNISFFTLSCICLVVQWSAAGGSLDQMADEFYYGEFPTNFSWGSATAAYQIEGAWNVDGKSESIWDTFCRVPYKVADGTNGSVACDSYNKYMKDVEILKNMGVKHYKFSLSWSRIIPDPTTGVVNQRGLDYYHRLIDALLEADIEPMVTLYHWDLPDILETRFGGWKSEKVVQYFNYYANISFAELGPKVKWWITFNEPWVVAYLGYCVGRKAPGLKEPAEGPYKAAHTIIKSHAAAWHTYNNSYRSTQKGKISLSMDCDFKQPYNPEDPDDVAAAERQMQFMLGWFAHPIFVNGDYPDVMKQFVAKKSIGVSRLPEFTEEEKQRIKGTYDFFGLNHYTTLRVKYVDLDITNPGWENDQNLEQDFDPKWARTGSTWMRLTPWGFRHMLVWVKDHYGDVPIMVTENGLSDRNGSVTDDHRVFFFQQYINEMLKAIKLDGVNVIGYTAWTLMDNFEWERGFSEHFGIHAVDFENPEMPRTPKRSAIYLTKLFKRNSFVKPNTPDWSKLTILFLAVVLVVLAIVSCMCYILCCREKKDKPNTATYRLL